MINYGSPTYYLETDASMQGWGAVFEQSKTQGIWSTHSKNFHINVLEMLAVKYALLSLCSQVNSCHVYIKSDSVTVVH
jgi:ribonuclease HI